MLLDVLHNICAIICIVYICTRCYYKLFVKTKKSWCFLLGFACFKKISFIKKLWKENQKLKLRRFNKGLIWELHDIIREIHFGTLVLANHCYSGNKKIWTSFRLPLSQRKQEPQAVEKNLRVSINFYKKLCLLVLTWSKKHVLKQVMQVKYTLVKTFFAVPNFEGSCVVVFFFLGGERLENL